MKYLTLLKLKPGPPPEPKLFIAINEGVKAWIKAHVASGKLDCAYNVMPSANGYYGMGIANFSTPEEGFAILATYPAYAITDFEVYPLSDVFQAIDNVTEAIQKMTGG